MKVDTIIVGHGLAGALFAHKAHNNGHSVCILDRPDMPSASSVAAGLINPITGRNYVLSWKFALLHDSFVKTYRNLESFYQLDLLESIEIHRVFEDDKGLEKWMIKSADPVYQPYMSEDHNTEVDHLYKGNVRHGIVNQAYRLNLQRLIEQSKIYFSTKNCFLSERFDHQNLKIEDSFILYKNIEAKRIVFCEGAGIKENPLFNQLPVRKNKGEIMIIKSPEYPKNLIAKKKYFTVPLSDDEIWYGTINSWGDQPEKFTDSAGEELTQGWQNNYNLDMMTSDTKWAHRLAVNDRRPIIGEHQQYKNVFLLNGFGTKGSSLAPFFTDMLWSFMAEQKAIWPEVDVKRFYK